MDNNDFNRSRDVEVSHEVAPDAVWTEETSEKSHSNNSAKTLGIISIALSLLSFFSYMFMSSLFAPAGIVLGVIGVKKGSAIGWLGIVLGVLAIVIRLITIPIRLIF